MLFNYSICCVITNYNHSKYINQTVRMVFKQSINFDQVIIVDDGSNDNSFKILKLLSRKYKFKLIQNKKNLGINYSFNKALKHVKTKFLFSMAMDDIYSKNLVKYFKLSIKKYSNYNPNILIGHADGTFENGKKIYQKFSFKKSKYLNKYEFINFYLKKPFEIFGGNAILNVKKTKKLGGYLKDLYWHSDWMLYFLILLEDGLVIFPKKIVSRRLVKNSYSSNINKIKYEKIVILNFLRILKNKFKNKYNLFKKNSILPNYRLELFFYLLKEKPFRKYLTFDLLLKIMLINTKRLLVFLLPNKIKLILKK